MLAVRQRGQSEELPCKPTLSRATRADTKGHARPRFVPTLFPPLFPPRGAPRPSVPGPSGTALCSSVIALTADSSVQAKTSHDRKVVGRGLVPSGGAGGRYVCAVSGCQETGDRLDDSERERRCPVHGVAMQRL